MEYTIVNGGNIRNLTLPMPEALDGYYEDIVTYAIPLERQPEDTSLKPTVTFGNLKSAVIKDESKAVNRDEKLSLIHIYWVDQGIYKILPDGRQMVAYGGDFGDRPNLKACLLYTSFL